LRTNVAVIGNAMIMIRLPDLPCPDERRQPGEPNGPLQPSDRATREDLYVPGRFLPCWDAGADDLAEEIARHQASTSRALSDEVRESMHSCAREVAGLGQPDRRSWKERQDEEEEKQRIFERLSQITDMADRQLSRLLRRLGSYGETDESEKSSRAADMRRRYRYALDEIRSLERELASVRDRHRAHMDAQSQIDRSRFEDLVALAGAAILLPALVVGVFSANVWLPGREDAHRFAALILMILGCALGAVVTIDRVRARKLPETGKQWGAAALVAVSFLMALVLLVT
jgi:chromosome segregation ATPase